MLDTLQKNQREAAVRLQQAADSGEPCRPVRDLLGPDDIGSAYAVQAYLIAARNQAGDRRVGRKIGLTAASVQLQLGVSTPDFGSLLTSMQVPQGAVVPTGRVLQPKVEGEVAFLLGADLAGTDMQMADVQAAVSGACAAIEIVDSRIKGWDIAITDTVADNASSGLFVLSGDLVPLGQVEPKSVRMTLWRNGEIASSGTGADCMGDPLASLLWLARTASEFGDPLRAGEIVLSGALGPMVAVLPGDHITTEISGLGKLGVLFAGVGP